MKKENCPPEFPAWLKDQKNKLAMTQVEFAEVLSVSWHTVLRWLNSESSPSPLELDGIYYRLEHGGKPCGPKVSTLQKSRQVIAKRPARKTARAAK